MIFGNFLMGSSLEICTLIISIELYARMTKKYYIENPTHDVEKRYWYTCSSLYPYIKFISVRLHCYRKSIVRLNARKS